jgi:hypothetical protein
VLGEAGSGKSSLVAPVQMAFRHPLIREVLGAQLAAGVRVPGMWSNFLLPGPAPPFLLKGDVSTVRGKLSRQPGPGTVPLPWYWRGSRQKREPRRTCGQQLLSFDMRGR